MGFNGGSDVVMFIYHRGNIHFSISQVNAWSFRSHCHACYLFNRIPRRDASASFSHSKLAPDYYVLIDKISSHKPNNTEEFQIRFKAWDITQLTGVEESLHDPDAQYALTRDSIHISVPLVMAQDENALIVSTVLVPVRYSWKRPADDFLAQERSVRACVLIATVKAMNGLYAVDVTGWERIGGLVHIVTGEESWSGLDIYDEDKDI
jgi:hypothetical protein